jgi:hypothetical protein
VDVFPCPGCGLVLPRSDGPTHPYIGASAACWALFGRLSADGYAAEGGAPWQRLALDTYAVQHPGVDERRAVQSVGVHLMRLCAILEHGLRAERANAFIVEALARRPIFHRLEPPQPNGTITVRDVLRRDDRESAVKAWAQDVWAAWTPHHEKVRAWIDGLSTS